MTKPSLRRATLQDASPIAAFHLRIWRQTYDGIVPPEALRVLDLPHRLRQWQKTLADTAADRAVWVAEAGGEVVGLAACSAPQAPVFQPYGEISYLYVDPACRGQGLGRDLLAVATGFLRDAGFPGAALAVVRQNTAARDFYRHLGGTETAEFTDPGPIWPSDDVLVIWNF